MRNVILFATAGLLLLLGSTVDAQTATPDVNNNTTCYATGDVNGDGITLTISDLSALIAFVYNGVLPSGPLWQCDLNGDKHVDQLDIDKFRCYLTYGMSCFPVFPVPTDCEPDTVRGACCEDDSCTVKAKVNCDNVSGAYLANGVFCETGMCGCSISGTKFFDVNHNGIWDAGEPGLPGWKIGLSGGINRTTTTDANGQYSFTGLPCDNTWYEVSEFLQKGWYLTYPLTLSHSGIMHPGDVWTNKNFGNRYSDVHCVWPPANLVAWWPLNEPSGAPIIHDIAGANNGVFNGLPGPTSILGKVGNAFQFDGTDDRIFAPKTSPGAHDYTNLTIDAWIYPHVIGPQQFIIQNGPWICYALLLEGDELRLYIDLHGPTLPAGGMWPISDGANITPNVWTNIAVVAEQSTSKFYFYVNGNIVTTRDYSQYGVWYNAILNYAAEWMIGAYKNAIATPVPFDGSIDEVEVFERALSGNEIKAIYDAGTYGKCKDFCYAPASQTVCINESQVTMNVTVCNVSSIPATYDWQILGYTCPSSSFSGYVSCSPNKGTGFTVDPHKCRNIQVTATAPSNFLPGDLACYYFSAVNTVAGSIIGCEGSLLRTSKWCPGPGPSEPADTIQYTVVYPGYSKVVDYTVKNTDTIGSTLNYQITEKPSCSCDSTQEPIISLNGLPPGTDVTGSIYVSAGDSAIIPVTAELTAYRPFAFQNILLMADWESNGTTQAGASFAIHPIPFIDCNGNGILDSIDIADGTSPDTNSNTMPDECETGTTYLAGDANHDGNVNVGDAVYLVNYIFRSGPPPAYLAEGDANGDCNVNIGDAVYLVNYIFRGGPSPTINYSCFW